jgi:hypothetical protein
MLLRSAPIFRAHARPAQPVKFPGSKLLHHWDLAVQRSPAVDDLFRSCQSAGLTGLIEFKYPQSVGMIFYYLGGEVNALYREGAIAHNGQAALDRLREGDPPTEGAISIYELPLDVAHLLRGITNRQRLKDTLADRAALAGLLFRMEKEEHTGTLEIQTALGAAMVLLVRGRMSNTYWETSDGLTFEKKEAVQKLEDALARGGSEVQAYLSDFSRDVWKSRHEVQDVVRSRLDNREEQPPAAEQLAAEEMTLRHQALDELCLSLPSVTQAFLFDLLTGQILARKGGKGSAVVRVGLLADRVPALSAFLRDLVSAEDRDDVELFEVTTGRLTLVVAIVPQTQEGMAVVADRAQPTALIGATMMRTVRTYSTRVAARLGVA